MCIDKLLSINTKDPVEYRKFRNCLARELPEGCDEDGEAGDVEGIDSSVSDTSQIPIYCD